MVSTWNEIGVNDLYCHANPNRLDVNHSTGDGVHELSFCGYIMGVR